MNEPSEILFVLIRRPQVANDDNYPWFIAAKCRVSSLPFTPGWPCGYMAVRMGGAFNAALPKVPGGSGRIFIWKKLGHLQRSISAPTDLCGSFCSISLQGRGRLVSTSGGGKSCISATFFFAGFMMHDVYGSSGSSKVGGVTSHTLDLLKHL